MSFIEGGQRQLRKKVVVRKEKQSQELLRKFLLWKAF
jgi:hypothetical protein